MANSSHSPIEEILLNKFQQGQELVRIFRSYNIELFLEGVFGKLRTIDPSDHSFSFESYTCLILHESNQMILKIGNLSDRLMIKTTLAELFQAFIIQYIRPFPERIPKFIQAVKSTCEFHKYDFNDAYHFLRLYDLEMVLGIASKNKPYYEYRYHWQGTKKSFDELINEFLIHEYIYSKKEMKSLFDPKSSSRGVRVKIDKKLELAVAIDLLYLNDLIIIKGRNGKFIPLRKFVVVKEKELLYKTDPSRMIERAKRNQTDLRAIQGKILIWVKPIILSHNGGAVVKGLLPLNEIT